jgi:hypothetical protein
MSSKYDPSPARLLKTLSVLNVFTTHIASVPIIVAGNFVRGSELKDEHAEIAEQAQHSVMKEFSMVCKLLEIRLRQTLYDYSNDIFEDMPCEIQDLIRSLDGHAESDRDAKMKAEGIVEADLHQDSDDFFRRIKPDEP